MWLGHATIWRRHEHATVIIDPLLGNLFWYKRHAKLPIEKNTILADIILITHNHYDHFDIPSIKLLLQNNPDAILVTPTGFWRYLKNIIPQSQCIELKWWEEIKINEITITLTPSKHWCKRGIGDTNKASWGGYVVQDKHCSYYHSGDTAYGKHFAEISKKFDIVEAFLPIGAYKPEHIMKHYHIDPSEAMQSAVDLKASLLIPIHYGTFKLSDEPMGEPLKWFTQLMKPTQPFKSKIAKIGEVYLFNKRSQIYQLDRAL